MNRIPATLDVVVLGTGMTRFGAHQGTALKDLAGAAIDEALKDAETKIDEIDLVVFANAAEGVLTGQEMIRGQVTLQGLGLGNTPILNVENACASSSSAVNIASAYISAQLAETVLVVGAEKIFNPDKRRSMAMFSAATDLGAWPELRDDVDRNLLGITHDEDEQGPAQSRLMDIYAQSAQKLFASSDWTVEHAAEIAVKNRSHAAYNERAQYREPITIEEVLASRMISDPLRLLMCCPLADGSGAMVLTAAKGDVSRVRVIASQLRTGGSTGAPDVMRAAASAAYEQAGVGPQEVNVVEVHDASSAAELGSYEPLGLIKPGEEIDFLRSRAPYLGGRQPVNPSGGLLSRGHPIGATGIAQIIELVDQLNGRAGVRQVEGARIALAQNSGGYLNGEEGVSVITVLQAPER